MSQPYIDSSSGAWVAAPADISVTQEITFYVWVRSYWWPTMASEGSYFYSPALTLRVGCTASRTLLANSLF